MPLPPVDRQVASFDVLARRFTVFQQIPASLLPTGAKTASDESWLAWARSDGLCGIVEWALGDTDIEIEGDVVELLQPRVSKRLEASDRTRWAVIAAAMDLIDDADAILAELRADEEPDRFALDCTLELRDHC